MSMTLTQWWYPHYATTWQSLIKQDVLFEGLLSTSARRASRKFSGALAWSWQNVDSLAQKSRIPGLLPTLIKTPFSKSATLITEAGLALVPYSPEEKKQQLVRCAARTRITRCIPELGLKALTMDDFNEKTAAQIEALVDKIALLRRLIALQGELAVLAQHYSTHGLVRLSQLPLFSTLTTLFSTSCLRLILHPKVCLIQEVGRLKQIASILQTRIETNSTTEIIKSDLTAALSTTKSNAVLLSNQLHLFFNNQDKKQAVWQLHQLAEHALSAHQQPTLTAS